jgi:large subunit ribosomal protein L23
MLDWRKMHIYEVLRRPIVTEKNAELMAGNKYAFEVAAEANKRQIKEAVEAAFKVKVTQVNVITVPAKTKGFGRLRGETSPWKKAIVTLERGQKLEIFEQV